MIYRKNSACRRASAATFFSPVLSLRRCTTRYNCRNIFEAEGVADSQFNFMAYTVSPFAAAYLYVRHLLSSFYIYSPPPSFFLHPLKNFSTRHPRNFQITSPFSSSFLKIYLPALPSCSIFSVAPIFSIPSSVSCFLSEIARSTVYER